ncbi:RNA polymerase sigma factor [Aquimarina sediminis]|uniref:RNA polymerase sigma factor n=1 Tax=Aquimarina sediminis TaxID=2070536 RepID=UPI000CA079C6|nr:sigma-70 family RNA polymerase sigma factor [Aquimarina sediminis]
MNSSDKKYSRELADHFFRNEYGKIVSVVTKYIGTNNVETAEDIVQETLLKAVDYWQHHGIPNNPQAWLYTTAKNHTLNILKRKKHKIEYESKIKKESTHLELQNLQITEDLIKDQQLKMMFVCCHPSISENSQIALILKILCGFSITEIANAFFTTKDTINKRLVRGRKQLKTSQISFDLPKNHEERLNSILKTIYLLFNEGYSPSQQNKVIRHDLCFEAIRLGEILIDNTHIQQKSEIYALLALMYLNTARFESRNEDGILVEMHKQNRKKWNQALINQGIEYLNKTIKENKISIYHILATISGYHCIAPSFEDTNWSEILMLYDSLLELQDTPLVRLNRSIPLAKVKGNITGIHTLLDLKANSDIGNHYLFHATLAEFYIQEKQTRNAIESLHQAISLCNNERDILQLEKKIKDVSL